jgi:hypothetical protein
MLAQAEALLGVGLNIRQRWRSTSVGLENSRADVLVSRPMPTVRVVQALRSTAAALCHVRAGSLLDQMLVEPPPTSKYIRVQDLRAATENGRGVRDHATAFGSRKRFESQRTGADSQLSPGSET